MAEKAALKKEQPQKNKKQKSQEKNKNQKNAAKPVNKSFLIYPAKKKNKNVKNKNSNSHSYGENNVHKTPRKKSGTACKSLFWATLCHAAFILLAFGFIYIVDFEKFVRIRDGAGYYVNKTLSVLPPEVVTKGKQVVEFFQPVAEITLHKGNVFINETSTFLNTNSLVKEHWANIREISSVCSARLVDYMRTLYLQTTGIVTNFKKKIF